MFGVPELLEKTLIQLSLIDVKSVFALQRVNTAFKDTINRSKKVRRMICLDPLLDGEEEGHFKLCGPKVNPLCFDKRVGGMLWPALLHAWANEKENQLYRSWHRVEVRYYPTARSDWRGFEHGSWRRTRFAMATAESYRLLVSMFNETAAMNPCSQPHVFTHTTLGEIVDKYVDMLRADGELGKGGSDGKGEMVGKTQGRHGLEFLERRFSQPW